MLRLVWLGAAQETESETCSRRRYAATGIVTAAVISSPATLLAAMPKAVVAMIEYFIDAMPSTRQCVRITSCHITMNITFDTMYLTTCRLHTMLCMREADDLGVLQHRSACEQSDSTGPA